MPSSPRNTRRNNPSSLDQDDNGQLNLVMQSLLTIVAAIIFSGLVFTGILVFKDTDEGDILAQGNRYMVEGKIAKSIQQYKRLIFEHPNSYEGHLALGKAYLALKKPESAEKYFKLAAQLPQGDHKNIDVHLAQSQLFLSQQSFEQGAALLASTLEDMPEKEQTTATQTGHSTTTKRQDVIKAIIELNEQWASHLNEQEEFASATEKYKEALNYVNDYGTEKRLKSELIHTASLWSNQLLTQNKEPQAIDVLKQALDVQYDAKLLISIADIYKKSNQLDKAIVWYRKAYDAEPEQITLTLSELLVTRGKQLQAAGKRGDAISYFDESDKLLSNENTSPHLRYPVIAKNFTVSPGLDRANNSLQPSCKVTLVNQSHRSLPYLKVKASFWSNDTLLSEAELLPINDKSPLEPEGLANSSRAVSLKAPAPIDITHLKGQSINIKLSVGYKQPHHPILWDLKSVQEIQLKTSSPPTDLPAPLPSIGSSKPTLPNTVNSAQPKRDSRQKQPPKKQATFSFLTSDKN
jgi:tetratricopeptide (TPR) repeat protein